MRFRSLAPLALVAFCTAATAQLYSWKDASGKIHYSDQPPPDTAATRKLAPPATGAGDPAATQRRAEREMATRKQQKESQEAAGKAEKEKADAEQRRSECERAQANVRAIETGQARFTINSKGERVVMEGDFLAAELAKARQAADSWCK